MTQTLTYLRFSPLVVRPFRLLAVTESGERGCLRSPVFSLFVKFDVPGWGNTLLSVPFRGRLEGVHFKIIVCWMRFHDACHWSVY